VAWQDALQSAPVARKRAPTRIGSLLEVAVIQPPGVDVLIKSCQSVA